MTYNELLKLFNTRAKGRDFKTMYNGACNLVLADDGALELRRHTWEHNPNYVVGSTLPGYDNPYWVKSATTEFLRITLDNVMELRKDVQHSDNQAKNIFRKVAGFGRVTSRKGSHKAHADTLRFLSRGVDLPFTKGFKVDLVRCVVLEHKADLVLVTNKDKSRPVYEYVREVMRVMEVLLRFGDLTYESAMTHRWKPWKHFTDQCTSFDLTEENMAVHATQFYRGAVVHYAGVESYQWVTDSATSKLVRHTRSPEEVNAERWAKVSALAARKLREHMKAHHDCYDKEVAQPERLAA